MTSVPAALVDAFADGPGTGNPAAVMVLDHWLPDDELAAIAAEWNQAETAFVVASGDEFALRWFTPTVEIDLCGHATLAAAHVLFEGGADAPVWFATAVHGELVVDRWGDELVLDFPVAVSQPHEPGEALRSALGAPATAWRVGRTNHLVVLETPEAVAALTPDLAVLAEEPRGVIVTAATLGGSYGGHDCDFVSRYFAPSHGIDEDSVTGSAHCMLAPYWASRLGRTTLRGRQISARGGTVGCALAADRVHLSGRARTVMTGTYHLG